MAVGGELQVLGVPVHHSAAAAIVLCSLLSYKRRQKPHDQLNEDWPDRIRTLYVFPRVCLSIDQVLSDLL
jgi:hypothetical protein